MSSAWTTTARRFVGDHHPEYAPEERPGGLAPGDHIRRCLPERQPHEAVPRVAGGEDQRPHHPPSPAGGVEQQAHPPEIHLAFGAGLAVGHPHRHPFPLGEPAALHREPVQGAIPIRHPHPPSPQQIGDLGEPQTRPHPATDQLLVWHQSVPRRAVATRTGGADHLAHRADQRVAELALTPVAYNTASLGSRHVAVHRLAVHPGQPGDRPEPLAPQPQPQHLTDLEHGHLPERHPATSDSTERGRGYHARTARSWRSRVVP